MAFRIIIQTDDSREGFGVIDPSSLEATADSDLADVIDSLQLAANDLDEDVLVGVVEYNVKGFRAFASDGVPSRNEVVLEPAEG